MNVGRRLPQTDGAGEVGRIATDHGAHIDHDWLPLLNRAIARVVMWARTVRSGGDDDREAGTIRAEIVHRGLDAPRQRLLGDAGLQRPRSLRRTPRR